MRRITKSVVLTGRAEEFRFLFQKSGWSQAEAARRTFVSSNHVNMILRGNSEPSKTFLEFFRLQVDGAIVVFDSELASLVASINGFEPQVRTRVIATLKAVLGILTLSAVSVSKP